MNDTDPWDITLPPTWELLGGHTPYVPPRYMVIGSLSVRCRMGLHVWRGWRRWCWRHVAGDVVTCRFAQLRDCALCPKEEEETLGVWTLSVGAARQFSLITDDDGDAQGVLPGIIDVGVRRDVLDSFIDGKVRVTESLVVGWRCLLGFHYYTHRTPGDDPVIFALGPTSTLRCDRCRRIAPTQSLLDRISLVFATPGHMWRVLSRKQRRALGVRRS